MRLGSRSPARLCHVVKGLTVFGMHQNFLSTRALEQLPAAACALFDGFNRQRYLMQLSHQSKIATSC